MGTELDELYIYDNIMTEQVGSNRKTSTLYLSGAQLQYKPGH
jgi:hypothetical protein